MEILSIYLLSFIQFRVAGGLKPILSITGQRVGYSMDKLVYNEHIYYIIIYTDIHYIPTLVFLYIGITMLSI